MISETTVATLTVAIITLISTLAGVVITNRSNHKKQMIELNFRSQDNDKKLLVEKKESLFMVLEDLNHTYGSIFKVLKSDRYKKDFIEYFRGSLLKTFDDQKKLTMLVHLYFPQLIDDIEEHFLLVAPLKQYVTESASNDDINAKIMAKDFGEFYVNYRQSQKRIRELVSNS